MNLEHYQIDTIKAYKHRKGLLARFARFLEMHLKLKVLHGLGWVEIPLHTSGTGDRVTHVGFDAYFD